MPFVKQNLSSKSIRFNDLDTLIPCISFGHKCIVKVYHAP